MKGMARQFEFALKHSVDKKEWRNKIIILVKERTAQLSVIDRQQYFLTNSFVFYIETINIKNGTLHAQKCETKNKVEIKVKDMYKVVPQDSTPERERDEAMASHLA